MKIIIRNIKFCLIILVGLILFLLDAIGNLCDIPYSVQRQTELVFESEYMNRIKSRSPAFVRQMAAYFNYLEITNKEMFSSSAERD